MITIDSVVNFSLGGIVTFAITEVIRRYLARLKTIEDANITNFIADYRTFKKVFIHALQLLARSDTSFLQVITAEFPKHDLAIQEFILELDGDRYDRLNAKWAEYKEVYEKWSSPHGPGSNMQYLFDQIRTPGIKNRVMLSDDKDTIDAVNQLFQDDSLNKRYYTYLIKDLLDIAKKY